jgi:hypothetical protein
VVRYDPMPIFKRREQPEQDPVGGEDSTSALEILDEITLRGRLDVEGSRAGRYGRPLTVLCVVPQLLPHEGLAPEEVNRATEVVRAQLRLSDHLGVLANQTLVALLPETLTETALAVAQRLASELSIRSAAVTHRVWRVGVASCPTDGQNEAALIDAAVRHSQP